MIINYRGCVLTVGKDSDGSFWYEVRDSEADINFEDYFFPTSAKAIAEGKQEIDKIMDKRESCDHKNNSIGDENYFVNFCFDCDRLL